MVLPAGGVTVFTDFLFCLSIDLHFILEWI